MQHIALKSLTAATMLIASLSALQAQDGQIPGGILMEVERVPRPDNDPRPPNVVTYCTIRDATTGSDGVELKDNAGAVIVKFARLCIDLEERQLTGTGDDNRPVEFEVLSLLRTTLVDNKLMQTDPTLNYVVFEVQFFYDVRMTMKVDFPTNWHMPHYGFYPAGAVEGSCEKNVKRTANSGQGSQGSNPHLNYPLLPKLGPTAKLYADWTRGGNPCP